MMTQAYVHEATVIVSEGTNPAAVGAAVTVALCGHWEHDGPCRWPHNNQIQDARFRTIFVAAADDEPEVRRRIRAALHSDPGWRVCSDYARDVAQDEEELASQLARAPRRE
jgi:hypothetical protein